MRIASLLVIGFLLTACGYRFGEGALTDRYSSITVPYITGDATGELTALVIRELNTSGSLSYKKECADLILLVEVIQWHDENIGFRYYVNKKGKRKDYIVPTETRISAVVQVQVIESVSGCSVLGPVRLRADVDFDHDYYSSRNAVNIFSLGQLSDVDEAHDAAMHPINKCIAKKVVSYLINAW